MTDFPKLPRVRADDESMEKMHVAARKGQTEELQRLIEMGIDPSIANRFGCTALHLACKFGQVETAKYLASICDVQTAWHGQKPLHLAVLANKLDLVEALLAGARERGKPLDAMLNDCDENAVTEIGTHFKDCKGQTALHWCIGLGSEYLPMLKLLVASGASPSAKDREGETCLMRAMEFNNDEAMSAMLDGAAKGALRMDYVDQQGRSHLHWAILTNHQTYALRFVELGHDVNMEDEAHTVPLYLAIRAAMPTLTALLLEQGDPFLVQNCTYHNGSTVLPERVEWLDFVLHPPAAAEAETAEAAEAAGTDTAADVDGAKPVEERQQEVLRLLQERLDEIMNALAEAAGTTTKKKKNAGSVKRIALAPSAPIRSRSKASTSKK